MIDREQVIENYFQCWINENSLILKKLLIQMQSIVNVMDPNTMVGSHRKMV
ncbi:MAG: hypothetical protein Q8930_09905 [Bacillota bacterium]|nr:hypothetical protein [Bacillota bacterium]